MERQKQNYAELEESVRELAGCLKSQAHVAQVADARSTLEPESSLLDQLLEGQQAVLEKSGRTDQVIRDLKQRLAQALGKSDVTLQDLRMALSDGTLTKDCKVWIDRIESLTDELIGAVKRIQAATEQNEVIVRNQSRAIKRRLEALQVGRRAAQAYGELSSGDDGSPRFIDRQK